MSAPFSERPGAEPLWLRSRLGPSLACTQHGRGSRPFVSPSPPDAGAPPRGAQHTGGGSSPPSDGLSSARGVIRLLNTPGGRLLCLAGEVDAAAVASFLRRYGHEPARIDAIDAGSVTSLSTPALPRPLDHLEAGP